MHESRYVKLQLSILRWVACSKKAGRQTGLRHGAGFHSIH